MLIISVQPNRIPSLNTAAEPSPGFNFNIAMYYAVHVYIVPAKAFNGTDSLSVIDTAGLSTTKPLGNSH